MLSSRHARHARAAVVAALASSIVAGGANAVITLDPLFINDYTFESLGPVSGVPANLGGLTFKAGDPNTLLIGGAANGGNGAVYSVGLTRSCTGQITGFAGAATSYASAQFIDGGLDYSPDHVLFYTTYSNNTAGQIKPGSSAPDKVIPLGPLGVLGSTGTLLFTPDGFAGAGRLKIASYSNGGWYDATITPDGSGTYDITGLTLKAQINGGPEGIVYIDGSAPQFNVDSVLISEYGTNRVVTYAIDANGDPIPATQRIFMTGLGGAEGAAIDPLTGDFLFSTFGGGNQVVIVHGFGIPCAADQFPSGGDGVVDVDDLFYIINHWAETCTPVDITNDGVVDIDDLFAVINQWGPCQ